MITIRLSVVVVHLTTDLADDVVCPAGLKYPLYVKPANLGSSIGINVVKTEQELDKAVKEAIKFDRKVLIEEGVANVKEVNVSVYGNYEKQVVSDIEEII